MGREGQKLFLLAHDRRAPCVCLLTSCCVTSCFMFRCFLAATSDQQITHQRGFVTRLIYLGWVIGFLAFASSISLVIMDYCKELRKIIQPPPRTRFREPIISKVKKGGTHNENGGGFGKEIISRRDHLSIGASLGFALSDPFSRKISCESRLRVCVYLKCYPGIPYSSGAYIRRFE